MKHFTLAVAAVAFTAGIIVGRITLSTTHKDVRGSATTGKGIAAASNGFLTRSVDSSNANAASLCDKKNLIAAINHAGAHAADSRVSNELSDLIDTLDIKNVRPVIEAVEQLQNQRQKNISLGMLISRWAEADPQAALAYAQMQEGGKANWLMSEVITTWGQLDSASAIT